ncbi:MAG: chemotaxis protein CheA [Deltaproteobacteria bacterium]|nr:chemotaxis protein CheA [Deltaproteobacteria bacterium]
MDELELDREALIATFTAEARDLLDEMEGNLLALEEAPADPERLHAVFRAAHTLKGGAATVGFEGPRDLAHDLESLLDGLRSGAARPTPEVVTLLLQAVDHLRQAIPAAAAGRDDAEAREALRARLAALSGRAPARLAPEQRPAAPRPSQARARTLRVAVERLDRMMDLAGEIAISRGRLADLLERGAHAGPEALLEAHRESDRLFQDLQELIMKARMVPLGPVFQQQQRTARDVAAATGRQVRLAMEGADVEVDTAVVELVRDPLTHLVRNAVDHGIEAPEARAAGGKEPCGRVVLRGYRDTGGIVIQVEDDGRGLDRGRIAARAQAMGLSPGGAAEARAHELVFEPGLSTKGEVTAISGRGVGMDVVRRNVEALRGTASLESTPGRGTTVTLRLPLTLAIIQGFRVAVAGETYVLPLDAVVECLELPARERGSEGTGVLDLRGQPLPYLRLRSHFGLAGEPPRRENVVVVRQGEARAGLCVDALLGESQTVVKPLGRMFQGVPGVSGSSILGDGRVALILDVAGLLREVLRKAAGTGRSEAAPMMGDEP